MGAAILSFCGTPRARRSKLNRANVELGGGSDDLEDEMLKVTPRTAVLAGVLLLAGAGSASAALVAQGKAAPAWSGKTVQGKTLSAAQFKGKVVLLNFFNAY